MGKNSSSPEIISKTYQAQALQKLWRAHTDSVSMALVAPWRPLGHMDTPRKTDLSDEAVSDGLSSPPNSLAKKVFYTDSAQRVREMAKRFHSRLQTIGADVRDLPFANGAPDAIKNDRGANYVKKDAWVW